MAPLRVSMAENARNTQIGVFFVFIIFQVPDYECCQLDMGCGQKSKYVIKCNSTYTSKFVAREALILFLTDT